MPLREIVIGPNPLAELARTSVIDFLASQKLAFPVAHSRVPFRVI